MNKAVNCDTSIPYGHDFVSWLLCFQSSFLLIHLGKQQSMTQLLAPLYPDETPGSWLRPGSGQPSPGHSSHVGSEPEDGNLLLPSLSCPLFLILLFKYRDKSLYSSEYFLFSSEVKVNIQFYEIAIAN